LAAASNKKSSHIRYSPLTYLLIYSSHLLMKSSHLPTRLPPATSLVYPLFDSIISVPNPPLRPPLPALQSSSPELHHKHTSSSEGLGSRVPFSRIRLPERKGGKKERERARKRGSEGALEIVRRLLPRYRCVNGANSLAKLFPSAFNTLHSHILELLPNTHALRRTSARTLRTGA
jgi:hypothetical protein